MNNTLFWLTLKHNCYISNLKYFSHRTTKKLQEGGCVDATGCIWKGFPNQGRKQRMQNCKQD